MRSVLKSIQVGNVEIWDLVTSPRVPFLWGTFFFINWAKLLVPYKHLDAVITAPAPFQDYQTHKSSEVISLIMLQHVHVLQVGTTRCQNCISLLTLQRLLQCAIPTAAQGANQAGRAMQICDMWNNNIYIPAWYNTNHRILTSVWLLCTMQAREGPTGAPDISSSSYQTCSTQTHVMLSTSWLTTQRHAAGCSQRQPNCWQNKIPLQMVCCVML